MRIPDPATIFTKRGTPVILIGSRLLFIGFFITFAALVYQGRFPMVGYVWMVYLLGIYVVCEQIYAGFKKRGIDLTFAFPLLFAVYVLHFVSLLVRGQEELPIMNRAEHFASFVLLAYIVWVFFLKYLPQDVWQKHPYYTALLVLSITSLAGVGNEVFELFFDSLFGTRTIGTGFDTSLDLLMNTLGSGLFLAVQLILHEGRHPARE